MENSIYSCYNSQEAVRSVHALFLTQRFGTIRVIFIIKGIQHIQYIPRGVQNHGKILLCTFYRSYVGAVTGISKFIEGAFKLCLRIRIKPVLACIKQL